MTDVLATEDRGAVRILTMNRPDKRNALDMALTRALKEALEAADADEAVRAVVLAGAGKGFCAGADLGEFKELTPKNQNLVLHRAELSCQVQMLLQEISKPVVSAVQGAAVGGGAGLAVGCDMMIAGADLKFGYPELKHSIVPALVMTGLERAVGRKTAFEMVSLGRLVGAEEAVALGIANRVADDPLAEALEVAAAWAEASPQAMAAAKRLFYRVADLPYGAAMEAGRDTNAIMRGFRTGNA